MKKVWKMESGWQNGYSVYQSNLRKQAYGRFCHTSYFMEAKMEFEWFINEIKEKLQNMVGMDYCFESKNIRGLNGTVKNCLIAVCENAEISPCINMDEYYKQYQKGINMDVLAVNILKSCRENIPVEMDIVFDFKDWDLMKYRIFAKLVNTEKNEGLLQKCPHRNYLDLSLVYYIRIDCRQSEEYGIVQIYNEQMLLWGVDEKTLYKMAWKNIQITKAVAFESIEDILSSFICLKQNLSTGSIVDMQMYVLGNNDRKYGAVHMCNLEALQKVAKLIGDDFWILPSSIHELILIPMHQAKDCEHGLAEIVKKVNDTQVKPQEILSCHVYSYNRQTGKVIIAT